jgi:hypothetical protein
MIALAGHYAWAAGAAATPDLAMDAYSRSPLLDPVGSPAAKPPPVRP